MTGRRFAVTFGLTALARAARAEPPARIEFPEPTSATGLLAVWMYRPPGWVPGGRVVAVLHGAGRDVEPTRDAWVPLATAAQALLVCPDFSQAGYPGETYNQGHGPGRPPVFLALPRAVAAVRAAVGDTGARNFDAYGHSAGAQFLHRFLLVCGAPGAGRMVAANAGFYTLPDLGIPWPYGLGGVGTEAVLRDVLSRPLTVLLGQADDDPQHRLLRRTPEAMAQGPHRLARGRAFGAAGREAAARLGVECGWRAVEVPGIGHAPARMAPHGAALLWP